MRTIRGQCSHQNQPELPLTCQLSEQAIKLIIHGNTNKEFKLVQLPSYARSRELNLILTQIQSHTQTNSISYSNKINTQTN